MTGEIQKLSHCPVSLRTLRKEGGWEIQFHKAATTAGGWIEQAVGEPNCIPGFCTGGFSTSFGGVGEHGGQDYDVYLDDMPVLEAIDYDKVMARQRREDELECFRLSNTFVILEKSS